MSALTVSMLRVEWLVDNRPVRGWSGGWWENVKNWGKGFWYLRWVGVIWWYNFYSHEGFATG